MPSIQKKRIVKLSLIITTLFALFIALKIGLAFWNLFTFDTSRLLVHQEQLDQEGSPKIPKILHQTFKTNATLPINWEKAQKSCRALNPEFQYIFWTDESARQFIEKEYPLDLENYDSYSYNIQRVDAMRYCILQSFGGIYLDLDIGCKKPLDKLLGFTGLLPQTKPFGVSNDMMAAEPRHPFFKQVIKDLKSRNSWYGAKYPTVMFSTGPTFIDFVLMRYKGNDMHVLPEDQYGNGRNSFFYHVHGSSWHGSDSSFVMFIYHHYVLSTLIGAFLLLCILWFVARLVRK